MKAVPVKIVQGVGPVSCEASECTHVMVHIPSRTFPEVLPVILRGTRGGTGCWTWNGDTEKPTLRPSILTTAIHKGFRCHCWVNEGVAKFLSDCSHQMVNSEITLLDVTLPEQEQPK